MYLIKSVIDILIIIFLLRLLIHPNEAYFDPIYKLIYRITDPLLIPARYVTRNAIYQIVLSVSVLVVLRGCVYLLIQPMTFLSGLGISLINLIQLLYRVYMVILIISVLSQRTFGTSMMNMIQRAFAPLSSISFKLRVPRQHFSLFSFIFLWVVYAVLSFIIQNTILPKSSLASFSLLHGLGEGLILVLSLFPGFFSLVVIVGALLSWVNPDPYNPIVQVIYGISEPLLAPFRKIVPNLGGLDISPILAILCFQIVGHLGQQVVARLIGLV